MSLPHVPVSNMQFSCKPRAIPVMTIRLSHTTEVVAPGNKILFDWPVSGIYTAYNPQSEGIVCNVTGTFFTEYTEAPTFNYVILQPRPCMHHNDPFVMQDDGRFISKNAKVIFTVSTLDDFTPAKEITVKGCVVIKGSTSILPKFFDEIIIDAENESKIMEDPDDIPVIDTTFGDLPDDIV